MADRMRKHGFGIFSRRRRSLRSFRGIGGGTREHEATGFENTVRRYVLDRTEDGFHVFEDKSGKAELRLITPAKYELSEGDIVDITFGEKGEVVSVVKDEAATEESGRKNRAMLDSLFDN